MKPRPPRFSVVTIVRNEAPRLPQLLHSLAEFRERGGEVVVLDTGSTDGTADLAAAAGCRVVLEPRRFGSRLTQKQANRIHAAFAREGEGPFVEAGERLFHFARARAHAASLAKNNFQLVLDGGDVVEALDLEAVDALISEGRFVALQFETRVRSAVGWQVELHDCFFNRRFLEWRGRAHNYLAPISSTGTAPMSRLPRAQLLVSHHTDLEKPRGYQLAGTALEALADPSSCRWGYFLGGTLAARGYRHSALPILMGLDRPDVPNAVRSAALCFAAPCLAGIGGSADEVDALLFKAARRDSGRRDPLIRLAQRSLGRGDMQGAAAFASAALSVPSGVGLSEPEDNHAAGPHAILYWALFWLGRRSEALVHFRVCQQLDPLNERLQEHSRLFA